MVEIWFEPHATTGDNEEHHASGWNDADLSKTGYRQADEMVKRSKQRAITVILCSDMQRAVKTAIPTAVALGVPIYPDRRLRECDYGDMTGESSAAIEQERPRRITIPFPDGESYEDAVTKRMASFFEDLKRNFNNQTVLIIGHRATQYGLEVFASGRTLEECMSLPIEYWVGADGTGKRYELKEKKYETRNRS